jgi:hypothetical protein
MELMGKDQQRSLFFDAYFLMIHSGVKFPAIFITPFAFMVCSYVRLGDLSGFEEAREKRLLIAEMSRIAKKSPL